MNAKTLGDWFLFLFILILIVHYLGTYRASDTNADGMYVDFVWLAPSHYIISYMAKQTDDYIIMMNE